MADGHGGKRKGAGRPAGAVTRRSREAAERAAASGLTPLDYMLSVLRDESANPADRQWAAEKAAPYVHPKLASVEHSGGIDHKHSVSDLTDDDLAHIAAGGSARAATPAKGARKPR